MERRRKLTGSLGYIVGLGVTAKFFVDISVQLFQPFLTIIAAGMGVGVVTMGRLVSVKNLMGLSAPLLGSFADKVGYRAVMRAGLLLTGVGFLLLATGAGLPVIIAGMVISGIGQAGYTPMIQAYLSTKLPYAKRSRYLGILEYSWALAGIVGLFLIGHLMEWFNWRVPLYILAGGFFGMTLIFSTLPKVATKEGEATSPGGQGGEGGKSGEGGEGGNSGESGEAGKGSKISESGEAGAGQPPDGSGLSRPDGSSTDASRPDGSSTDASRPDAKRGFSPAEIVAAFRSFFYLGVHGKSAWSAILLNFFNFFAISHVMIIHGGWLEAEYGLRAGQLGNVALLLGLTDWGASILVSIYGDRIGKKRSVFLGVGGMAVFFALMPILNVSLPMAILALALPRFCFEFATVSNFPLISEQFPRQRGKVMALSFSTGLAGPVISGMTGPSSYLTWGVWGLGPVSLASAAVSLVLLFLFVREEPYGREESRGGGQES